MLSRQTALKIGQLKYHLKEDENADDIVSEIVDAHLSAKLDLLVARRMPREVLLEALGMTDKPGPRQVTITESDFDDLDIAYLGDADEGEDIGPSTPGPIKGGLTDEVLAQDMLVDDPKHEAKGEALALDLSTPEAFAEAVGMPRVAAVTVKTEAAPIDPRVQRRKKNFGKGKGKVTPMTEDVVSESF